eukprot:TRINITY_DN55626_c0_g1_i1.p1 TRINITY_DN55626_c0_g1~~TRINITY_DN55626_c0_g1_i1.p1  ORF type:complete len:611 (+),score=199.33 TRINITY_DN55626_c0_g1_i1:132-1835(+)
MGAPQRSSSGAAAQQDKRSHMFGVYNRTLAGSPAPSAGGSISTADSNASDPGRASEPNRAVTLVAMNEHLTVSSSQLAHICKRDDASHGLSWCLQDRARDALPTECRLGDQCPYAHVKPECRVPLIERFEEATGQRWPVKENTVCVKGPKDAAERQQVVDRCEQYGHVVRWLGISDSRMLIEFAERRAAQSFLSSPLGRELKATASNGPINAPPTPRGARRQDSAARQDFSLPPQQPQEEGPPQLLDGEDDDIVSLASRDQREDTIPVVVVDPAPGRAGRKSLKGKKRVDVPEDGTAIYLKGLPAGCSETEVRRLLEGYGRVRQLTMLRPPADRQGDGTRRALAKMAHCDAAAAAIQASNRGMITMAGRKVLVEYKKESPGAQPHSPPAHPSLPCTPKSRTPQPPQQHPRLTTESEASPRHSAAADSDGWYPVLSPASRWNTGASAGEAASPANRMNLFEAPAWSVSAAADHFKVTPEEPPLPMVPWGLEFQVRMMAQGFTEERSGDIARALSQLCINSWAELKHLCATNNVADWSNWVSTQLALLCCRPLDFAEIAQIMDLLVKVC